MTSGSFLRERTDGLDFFCLTVPIWPSFSGRNIANLVGHSNYLIHVNEFRAPVIIKCVKITTSTIMPFQSHKPHLFAPMSPLQTGRVRRRVNKITVHKVKVTEVDRLSSEDPLNKPFSESGCHIPSVAENGFKAAESKKGLWKWDLLNVLNLNAHFLDAKCSAKIIKNVLKIC